MSINMKITVISEHDLFRTRAHLWPEKFYTCFLNKSYGRKLWIWTLHQHVFTCGMFFRRAWPGCREHLPGSGSSFLCKPKHKQSESLWVFSKIYSSRGLLFREALQLTLHIILCHNVDRVDKKRDKIERKILDSQERAFWDVHRPVVSQWANMVSNS